jgi:pre-mRNA-processing factor 6
MNSQPSMDKIGYLTQLNTSKMESEFIGDVKKARLLLKSAMLSNPKNPDIWISAARIEELDGKIAECREILRKAIEHCPMNEDIWI